MTAILGLSAFYHDSAAALVVDGRIVAAAQEERFTRKKHDAGFPVNAVAYCLEAAELTSDQLDYVVFYDKPFTKFERLLETYLAFAPSGLRSFSMAMPVWLKEKLNLRSAIGRQLSAIGDLECGSSRPLSFSGPVKVEGKKESCVKPQQSKDQPVAKRRTPRIVFTEHHESHAASAFFPSPFDEAAILTLDGVGEWSTTTCGVGRGNHIELTHELRFPHSLGLLYSAFTYYCGFKVNSGEYKLMGLAPYGKPLYVDAIYKHLIDLKPDGTFWLNMRYFNYCQGLTMTNGRFDRLLGGPPRSPESNLEQRHMDLAASIQQVTEEIVHRLARDLHRRTGMKHLVLAGGVALNCVANGRLLREGPYEDLWIQPAAGDAGGALGGALFVWHQLLDKPRNPNGKDTQAGSLLGPEFSNDCIEQFLHSIGMPAVKAAGEQDLVERVAETLADGKVVGWFQGRMEFGPRALGARSILGDARSPVMQATMNLKIKFRESFRPFAPVVLQEHAHEWFDMRPGQESPYMLLVAPVAERHRVPIDKSQLGIMEHDPDLRRRVNVIRSTVPAITHVDWSARVQTVDAERNPRFHRLLSAFHRLTACPVLVNTSFNVRGEPIVCTPEDAYRCFLATEMDVLVLEDFIVVKDAAGDRMNAAGRKQHLAQFQLD
jgi:carbamoyltransferase